ncbi:MAG TPA: DUF3667 domain-containing protein [Longimicrobiaceae bacterium]|nr:DUF3667 domain-containing protein [Longimicrobiaceae bacterium]
MLGFRKVRVPAISVVTAPARPAPAGPPCANCGDTTPGKYCPECGQARRTRLVSLREMAVDFLDDQLSFNSRLPTTVVCLLLRPGFLTQEYLRGRIARYIRPLRLYLGASVVFFLLLSVNGGGLVRLGSEEGDAVKVDASFANATDGSWVDSITVRTASPTLDHLLEQKRAHFRRMSPGEAFREVMAEFREHVPTTMFFLLPVFALLLKLLYRRPGRLYVEHFVFALHLHAFAFAAFTVVLLARQTAVSGVMVAWVLLYTFLSMKRVYGQSFLRTGLKYMALGTGYAMVISFGLAITAVITLLLV